MERSRIPLIIAVVAALGFILPGMWAFLAPENFFENAGPFQEYNEHYVHDVGAFQFGIGAMIAAAIVRKGDAIFAVLFGAGLGSAVHTVSHIIDRDLGGYRGDWIAFGVMTLVLLAGAWLQDRNLARR